MEIFRPSAPHTLDRLWPLSVSGECRPVSGALTLATNGNSMITISNYVVPVGSVLLLRAVALSGGNYSANHDVALSIGASASGAQANAAALMGTPVIGTYFSLVGYTHTIVSRHRYGPTITSQPYKGSVEGTGAATWGAPEQLQSSASGTIIVDRDSLLEIDEGQVLGAYCSQTAGSGPGPVTLAYVQFRGILVPKRAL